MPGAIHRFVYDLKCSFETRAKQSKTQAILTLPDQDKTENTNDTAVISSPTRIRKPIYEEFQKRHTKQKVRAVTTDKYRTNAEKQFLAKFTKVQENTELHARVEAEFEKQLELERMAETRYQTLKQHDNLIFQRKKLAEHGKKNWQANQV